MRFNPRATKLRTTAKGQSGNTLRRANTIEVLEGRVMLAGNTAAALAPWHNSLTPLDVNHDGRISPIDALLIIDDLSTNGAHEVPGPSATSLAVAVGSNFSSTSLNYLDVNGDNMVSPLDALQVLDALTTATTVMTIHTFATDLAGNLISQIPIGSSFKIEATAEDTRVAAGIDDTFPGVFSAYMNLNYNPALASVGAQVPTPFTITPTNPFSFAIPANAALNLSTPGLLPGIGALSQSQPQQQSPPQQSPGPEPLWSITVTATHAGSETFTPGFDSTAGDQTLLYHFNNTQVLQNSDITFIGTPVLIMPSISVTAPGPTNEGNDPQNPTPFVFSVSLSGPFSEAVTVQFATQDGSAKASPDAQNDYTASSGTLIFLPGQPTTQLVTVLVNGNTTVEGDETFSLVLSSPSSNATLSNSSTAVATILNDDFLPTLRVDPPASISNVGSGNINALFTVSLSSAYSSPVTVHYSTIDGTGPNGATSSGANPDFQATSGILTFTDATPQVITVVIVGDPDPDVPESFQVKLDTPVNANFVSGHDVASATIQPATPIPSISLANPTVSLPEGTTGQLTDFKFTVSLSNATNQQVLVAFATQDSTAKAAPNAQNDYQATSGTLVFMPNDTSQVVTVKVIGNTIVESSESFFLNLTAVSNATGTAQGVGNILNDDSKPVFNIGNASVVAVGTSGTTAAVFTVTLTSTVSEKVTIGYGMEDVSAQAGVDYQAQSGNLTFLPNQPLSQTITVPVINQPIAAPDETFKVNLSSPDPAGDATVNIGTGIGTIVRQGLTIGDASAGQGKSAVFTVTLTRAQSQPVTVFYATADGTGANAATAADNDFTPTSGSLTFQPGDPLTQLITVALPADTRNEANETFFVNLSMPSDPVKLIADHAVGTILNNASQKAAVQLVLADTDAQHTPLPAGTVLSVHQNFLLEVFVQDIQATPQGVFQAYLNAVYDSHLVGLTPNSAITFGPGFADGHHFDTSTAGQVNDTGAFQSGPPSAPGDPELLFSIPLTANDVGLANFSVSQSTKVGHEFFEFLSVPPGTPVNNAQINFVNTAANPLTINVGRNVFVANNVSIKEGDSGTTPFVFTVTRFLGDGIPANVEWFTSDGAGPNAAETATPDGDYGATSGTLSFSAADISQTVTVLVNGNTTYEADETFNVNLKNATETGATQPAVASASPGVGTIVNDDPAPNVSIASGSADEGHNLTFVVTLDAVSGLPATVPWSTAPSTSGKIAVANVNYTPTSGVLTFTAGTTQQTITVSSIYQNDQQDDETFQVILNPPATGATIVQGQATGTIVAKPPATISGFVYVDASNDGIKQATEIGIPGVTITATLVGGTTSIPPITTNADGSYAFTTLQPGTYTITETQPGFFANGTPASNQYSAITVQTKDVKTGVSFGEAGLRPQFVIPFHNHQAYFASSTGIGSTMNATQAVDLRGGDVWISYDAGWQGQRTINAIRTAGTQGTVTMTLYDNNLNPVAVSVPTDSGAQITFNGVTGAPYFLKLTGTATSVSLHASDAGASAMASAAAAATASAAPAAATATPSGASNVVPTNMFASSASVTATPQTSPSATDLAMIEDKDWTVELLLA